MKKYVNISEIPKKMNSLFKLVEEGFDVVVLKYKKPVLVIISYEKMMKFEEWKKTQQKTKQD